MLTFRKVSKTEFLQAFRAARLADRRIYNATSGTFEVDQATNQHDQVVLGDGGTCGFIVKNGGELIAVFSLVKGRGDAIVKAAIGLGAEYLDCFDGYLPKLYAKHGFVIVKRELNWTVGGPDVVYMQIPSKLEAADIGDVA